MLRTIVSLLLAATLAVVPGTIWATESEGGKALKVVDILTVKGAMIVGLENYPAEQKPELVLYIDEIAFKDLPELAFSVTDKQKKGLSKEEVQKILEKKKKGVVYRLFLLQRKEDSREAWRELYERNARDVGDVQVDVAIKLKDGKQLAMDVDQGSAAIPLIQTSHFVSGLAVLALLAAFFGKLARQSRIIRAVSADTPADLEASLIPFSLAKTQMATWFFLVAASYLFIWAVTGEVNSITQSELVLLGISASTALGAVLIEHNASPEKKAEREGALAEMKSQLQTTETEIKKFEEPIKDPGERLQQGEKLKKLRAQAEAQRVGLTVLKGESRGFLLDLVSDSKGVTFHRFQIVGWTLVLGLVYISSVYSSLTLPEFDPITLGLMGISSGTYLGFKFPEPKQG